MRRGYPANGDMYEEENEKLVDHLSGKVTALKDLSIDIGHEVRSQNKMLSEMDSDFDSTGGFLGSTMGRLTKMSKAGHNKFMCYLIIFALFVFFVLYYVIKYAKG